MNESFVDTDGWTEFDGASVLVTGGTGSFGSAFVRAVLENAQAKRIVVLSRDELKQYEMSMALKAADRQGALRFFIGDVRDVDRLEMALKDVDLIVHTAALKQVQTAEYNPFECIHTNVLGAENVVRAAIRTEVKKVIALSTDKAANPVNLYGASKLASDKIFIAANNLATVRGTQFSLVRYGNVLGSRGSVVPLFRRLVAESAGEIPITDERMTRFWITIQQGVEFVVSCFRSMKGGEIFVPKIPSMRITDLAEALAPGVPRRVIGIRPGEKLHETMITTDDARNTIGMDDRYVILPEFPYRKTPPASHYGGQPVDKEFHYSSDANDAWLSRDELRALLGEA